MSAKNTVEKVLERIQKTDTCWLWTGRVCNGYGYVSFEGKDVSVHQLIYESTKGKTPEGLELDHLCRVRNCANPDHLEPVTHQVNIARGLTGKTRGTREGRSICRNGHPCAETGPCAECHRERTRRWRQRQQESAGSRSCQRANIRAS